ncbi:hypothetical protein NPIL_547171, partial [Nephila pilipes]
RAPYGAAPAAYQPGAAWPAAAAWPMLYGAYMLRQNAAAAGGKRRNPYFAIRHQAVF